MKMNSVITRTAAVIVAHPDDETLWAGGTILEHPSWNWFIVCLCRHNDTDRAPKFYNVLKVLNAEGVMGDLDDGPDQKPLDENEVESLILNLLPPAYFDLIISHNPTGEYTKHLRHEETSRAVIKLWQSGKIAAGELWTFAYEDGNKAYFPQAVKTAPLYHILSEKVWQKKYDIITRRYGYGEKSWEAETTPRCEAFWKFANADEAEHWLESGGVRIKNVLK
jgi:LmbE family N-acetylglucosaminyl deacetylase